MSSGLIAVVFAVAFGVLVAGIVWIVWALFVVLDGRYRARRRLENVADPRAGAVAFADRISDFRDGLSEVDRAKRLLAPAHRRVWGCTVSARIRWALGLLVSAWALASSMGESGWALVLPLTAAVACTAAAICLALCEDTASVRADVRAGTR